MWPLTSRPLLVLLLAAALSFAAASESGSSSAAAVGYGSKNAGGVRYDPAQVITGCFLRPWVCRDRPFFLRPILCCRNVCTAVTSDVNNCGFCGIRCPTFGGCCNGICFNLLINIYHCGACFNRCPAGQLCVLGRCTQLAATNTTAIAGANGTVTAVTTSPAGP